MHHYDSTITIHLRELDPVEPPDDRNVLEGDEEEAEGGAPLT
jgi:hypothetical protein